MCIRDRYIITQEGTSEGTQIKYKKDGYWYKKDSRGHEGRAEYLVSRLLDFTTLGKEEYIQYEEGMINDCSGCRSRNFLEDGAELITFYRLYYNAMGKNLAQAIAAMDRMEDRIEYVIEFIRQSCGLDIRIYLRKILTLEDVYKRQQTNIRSEKTRPKFFMREFDPGSG